MFLPILLLWEWAHPSWFHRAGSCCWGTLQSPPSSQSIPHPKAAQDPLLKQPWACTELNSSIKISPQLWLSTRGEGEASPDANPKINPIWAFFPPCFNRIYFRIWSLLALHEVVVVGLCPFQGLLSPNPIPWISSSTDPTDFGSHLIKGRYLGWEIKTRLNVGPTGVCWDFSWGIQGILWMWEWVWKIPLTCSCRKMWLIQHVGLGLENAREFSWDEHQCLFLIRNSSCTPGKKKRGINKLFFWIGNCRFEQRKAFRKIFRFLWNG